MKIEDVPADIRKIDFLIMKRIIKRNLLPEKVIKKLWMEAQAEVEEDLKDDT